jgi:sugar O-acyltransferase (sialic acid O-acetyltransferase NeuD family)
MDVKKRLLIIGAGGFGRELESWLDRVPENTRDWRIYGYLDDNPRALCGFPTDYALLASIDAFEFGANDLAILALADPKTKLRVVTRLEGRVEFLTFIAPGTAIGKHVNLGRGIVVGLECLLTTNVSIGDFATINSRTCIGHDVGIGAYASLMGNVMVSGDCSIGQSAYVGTSATIIQGRRVGERAIVGAGGVVFRHVAPDTTVIGNPAAVFLDADANAA